MIIAGLLVSVNNFCLRRSIDAGGSSKAYLIVQLSIATLVMVLLNPVKNNNYTWDWSAVNLGLIGGLILGLLMWGLGRALEKGPPGLTIAVFNASTVMPAIVMVLLFGSAFGFTYTFANGLGSFLVLLGLFWAGWSSEKNPQKGAWACFLALIFLAHVLFLVYIQWWGLLLDPSHLQTALLPFTVHVESTEWFMPAVLFVAALTQILIYLVKVRKFPKGAEISYGILGGVMNGAGTFFLILAPQKASAWESAMIFPIFSVSIIVVCNAWAQILYKEKVNWRANTLALTGIIIGTVAWSSLS